MYPPYHNIAAFSTADYAGGLDHVRPRRLRSIGEPERSYREDPVRMLRAVRFAAKLDFRIDAEAAEPIEHLSGLLAEIPLARLFDEVLKLFHGGAAHRTFDLLDHYGLLGYLFPDTAACLRRGTYPFARPLLEQVLDNTDSRINQNKSVTPAFLYAAFLWLPLLEALGYTPGDPAPAVTDIQKAGSDVIRRQLDATAIPRRFTAVIREIWALQPRLQRYTGKRAMRLLSHPRFRAAYDFLCLRAGAGELQQEAADWWTEVQNKPPDDQERMADSRKVGDRPRRRRRRRGSRRRRAAGQVDSGT
jgi:poly(A) polymerase